MKNQHQGKSWLLTLCLGLGMSVLGAIPAHAQAATVDINIEWIDDRPADSTTVRNVTLFHHDGSFDLYDRGGKASPLIYKMISETAGTEDMEAYAPGVMFDSKYHYNFDSDPMTDPDARYYSKLDPVQHRFLTVFIPVLPSNDAFIANEDPYRIELFDLAQGFKGPLVIEFYGNEVMDAGVCVNDEAKLYAMDVWDGTQQQCEPEEGVISPHPGFNGSLRNPDATPQRILGASYTTRGGEVRKLDLEAADFSRPGARIGRLVIRAEAHSLEAASGSWYDPARSGEGFNVEYFRRAGSSVNEALVYWYTYQPDGSGKPLWLVGGGEVGTELKLYSMSGGTFASTDNPDAAESTLWGTIQLGVQPCGDTGSVRYKPVSDAFPTGEYPLRRLSPRTEAADWLCRLDKPDPLQLSE